MSSANNTRASGISWINILGVALAFSEQLKMGNTGGKSRISKEDMQFLMEKTQLDKESIQVNSE